MFIRRARHDRLVADQRALHELRREHALCPGVIDALAENARILTAAARGDAVAARSYTYRGETYDLSADHEDRFGRVWRHVGHTVDGTPLLCPRADVDALGHPMPGADVRTLPSLVAGFALGASGGGSR